MPTVHKIVYVLTPIKELDPILANVILLETTQILTSIKSLKDV